MTPLSVNLELARKYNVPGPRYTSYPTALLFDEKLHVEKTLEYVAARSDAKQPLSLYVHLPFCARLCWYCGCTKVITRDAGRSTRYVDALLREMDLLRKRLGEKRPLVQLHFGGGTPTFLPPGELRRLGAAIGERFPFADDIEAGVEIDPRALTEEHVEALREAGFNRASIGVQDLNPEVMQAVNRPQTKEQVQQALRWLRMAGFQSINMDLIYGLPRQTTNSFARTLETVLRWSPDRLAVYSYAHVPWMKPAQRLLNEAELPSPEEKLRLLKLSIETLTRGGYTYIGMDHFARQDDELARAQRTGRLQRNFQGYSTRGGADLHGIGMSSISQLGDRYVQNARELPAYYEAVEAGRLALSRGYVLNEDDRIRRRVIHHLLCHRTLDFGEMSRELRIDFRSYFAGALRALAPMEADGLVVLTKNGLRVTSTGRLFLRNLAMPFDAYLKRKPSEARYSKTV